MECGAQILLKIWLVFRVQIKCCVSGPCISSEFGFGSRVLMTKNWLKIQLEKKLYFFDQNEASLHDVQVTGEAFNPQKRTSGTSENEINFFRFLWVIFALLDPDPGTPMNPDPIRIWIYNTGSNSERKDLCFEAWKPVFVLKREICKPV